MNLQALMKQAQSMQKNILDAKTEIEAKTFIGKSELVEAKMKGNKKLISIKINDTENFSKEDLEIIEDMTVIAVNDALTQIEKEMNDKLGNQANALNGLI